MTASEKYDLSEKYVDLIENSARLTELAVDLVAANRRGDPKQVQRILLKFVHRASEILHLGQSELLRRIAEQVDKLPKGLTAQGSITGNDR